MKYLIGIDVGTSGTKSILTDTEGRLIASATAEYPMQQPQNGWAEQAPMDWWQGTCKTLREITAKVPREDIVGIGLSGQMHSLVLLDQDDRVIRPAILWCDQRTSAECAQMEKMLGREMLVSITANPALPGFTASKLLWIKNHEPESYEKIAHILLAKDYIRFQLTGEYATEVSDASGMQLLDVPKRCWSEAVCKTLGVDMAWLPRVYESPEITGFITPEASKSTGLPAGIPVAGGAGDNAAAAVGTGVCAPGKAFTSIGTSGVVFAPTGKPIIDPAGRMHTFCAAAPETWHVMGVTQAAGLSLNWFRRNLAPDMSYRQLDEVCEKLPIGSEKLLYLPYLMGERTPILDSDARGIFFGLSAVHTRAHMARSVMEGVSFSLYSCLELLRELNISTEDMVLCGGGSKSCFWRQLLCDLYGTPVKTVDSEGAALGAAILGGCAAGIFDSVQQGCERMVRSGAATYPDESHHKTYLQFYHIYQRLYPALKDSMHRLACTE